MTAMQNACEAFAAGVKRRRDRCAWQAGPLSEAAFIFEIKPLAQTCERESA